MEDQVETILHKGLRELLTSYSYHPILWSLYYTCKTLYELRPKVSVDKKVERYDFTREATLDGNKTALRDILYMDDRKNYTWFELYLQDGVAIVPKAWIPYLVARSEENGKVRLFLQPVRFCCRPVVKYSEPTVVKCESIIIDPRRKIHKEMYHVGIGSCDDEEEMFYINVPIYLGVKYLRNIAMYIEKFPLFVYVLQKINGQKYVTYVGGCEDSTLLCFLRHMLVCKNCFEYVERFVRVIVRLILREQSEETINLVYDDLAAQGPLDQLMVPYTFYFPDADYDDLFVQCFGKNKCNEISVFMNRFFENSF
jgi:hypothetical protein